MRISREVAFWAGGIALLLLALWVLSGVLLPFVAGLALAYLLDPLADRLERRGMSRTVATTSILVIFFGLLAIVIVLLYPVLARQIAGLLRQLPELVDQVRDKVLPYLGGLLERLPGGSVENMQAAATGHAEKAVEIAVGFVGGLITSGAALFDTLSLVVITPVVAFYLIRDWDKLVTGIDDWMPRRHRAVIHEQMAEIDTVLSGFVRGQLTVCLLLGIFYAVGLSLVGLNFGLVIGLVSGALTFIPFAGALIGLVATAIVAVIQFWNDPWWIAAAVGIFAVGQFIEGNVLSPVLVGDKVGLHPVWLMFALLAFGSVFGFVGVLLAVPAAAVIGVLVRFALGRYKASPLFLGDDG